MLYNLLNDVGAWHQCGRYEREIISRNEEIEMNKVLAKGLYDSIVMENYSIYKDLFMNTDIATVSDEYWKSSLNLFMKLSDNDKDIFFKILKQVSIDTISNMLAFIDGTMDLEDIDDVSLMISSKKIEDMQDSFLEYVEAHN